MKKITAREVSGRVAPGKLKIKKVEKIKTVELPYGALANIFELEYEDGHVEQRYGVLGSKNENCPILKPLSGKEVEGEIMEDFITRSILTKLEKTFSVALTDKETINIYTLTCNDGYIEQRYSVD